MPTSRALTIAYTPDMVPPSLKLLLALNPFAYFVVAYQQVVMLGIWPSTPHLIILVVMSLATFALGSGFCCEVVIVHDGV